MAAVVTTTTIRKKVVLGSMRVSFVTLAFDTGDYAAGGVAVTAAQLGLNRIDSIMFEGLGIETAATPTANIPRWNPTNTTTGKIQFFQGAGAGDPMPEKGAEAFGTGASVRLVAFGS